MTKELHELIYEKNKYAEPLSKEEQLKCFEEIKKGNKLSREKLICHSMRLVVYIVLKVYSKYNLNIEDLISVGTIGLVKSVDTYDENKGASFSTYAYTGICFEINKYIKRNRKSSIIKSFQDICIVFTDGSMADYDTMVKSDVDVEETAIKNAELRVVLELISELKERDQEFLKLYYGLYDRCYTLSEIGSMYGVSKAFVSKRNVDNIKYMACKIRERNLIDNVDLEKVLIRKK